MQRLLFSCCFAFYSSVSLPPLLRPRLSLLPMSLSSSTPVSLSSPELSMISIDNRLKSFDSWTQPSPVSVRDLASAGYFAVDFRSMPDVVRCFFCGSYAGCWVRDCDPLLEHLRLNPSCHFAKMKLLFRRQTAIAARKDAKKKKKAKKSSATKPIVKKAAAAAKRCSPRVSAAAKEGKGTRAVKGDSVSGTD